MQRGKYGDRGASSRAIALFAATLFMAVPQPARADHSQDSTAPRRNPPPMDLSGIISANDYPPEARARREQGTVVLRLMVSSAGRVTGCTVTRSATPTLDIATCELFKQRARFNPARNAAGEAIASEVDVPPIRWEAQ